MKRVYLDSATSMPVREEVVRKMIPFMTTFFGNPSSIHEMGREPRDAMEKARKQVANLISASPEEIIFTSGATESINLALRGPLPFINDRDRIVLSEADHRSVRATVSAIESMGRRVSFLPIDRFGAIEIDEASKIIDEDVSIVSVPFASNEVGTIQPLKEITRITNEKGALIHVDLTMSALQSPINFKEVEVDLATLSSPDLMGPKGVGALFVRKGTKIASLIKGGGQERGLRSGSENVAGMVGMGEAAEIASLRMNEDSDRMRSLRDELIGGLTGIEHSHLNGHPVRRLPNNANVRFDFVEGESMLLMLDMNGISVATGSACAQKTLEASKTLLAMGLKHEEAHGSLVFTLGPYNTKEDIDQVLSVMPEIVQELRMMSPIYNKE
jgi:cysteine desulfurase